MFAVVTFIVSFATWIVMSGKLDLFHLSLGGISCLLVAVISSEILFQEHRQGPWARFIEALRFIPYSAWLMYQIVLANFHVIGLALSPRLMDRELDPHVFTFTTRLKTDFARFVLANSITLTPGTVTVRIHGDKFYVHAISRKAGEDLESEAMSAMERRVAWVFEGGSW